MKLADILPSISIIDSDYLESVEALVGELNEADKQREWEVSSIFQEAKKAIENGTPKITSNDLGDLKLLTVKIGKAAGRISVKSAHMRLNRIKHKIARAEAKKTKSEIKQAIGVAKSGSTAEAKSSSYEEQQTKLLGIIANNTNRLIELTADRGDTMIDLLEEGAKETKAVNLLTRMITVLTAVLTFIALAPLVKSVFTPFAPYDIFWQKAVLLGSLMILLIILCVLVSRRLRRE